MADPRSQSAMPLPPTPPALHWPGTTGAEVVHTTRLREVRAAMSSLAHHGGVVTISGDTGLGKTFATDLAFQEQHIEKVWIAMPNGPRGKDTVARIHQAITGVRVNMRQITEYELIEEVVELLAGRQVAFVIDEAQHLTTDTYRQLRYLFDRRETHLVLTLTGVDVDRQLERRCPELHNRVERHIDFPPYPKAEMVKIVRRYHPMFANTGADALDLLLASAGGNFRNWAKLLKLALLADHDPDAGVTVDAARAIIRAVNKRPVLRNGRGSA